MEVNLEGFLQRLRSRPMICDGPMGTMLPSDASGQWKVPEELNVSGPEVVQGVQLAFD